MSHELLALRRGGKIVYFDNETIKLRCCKFHIFHLTMLGLERGMWCKKCFVSEGEKRIQQFLDTKGLIYHRERQFPLELRYRAPLRLDFYIPSLRFVIEYDGKGHFFPRKDSIKRSINIRNFLDALLRDQIKNQWCTNTNRSLLRIPFWNLESIDTILETTIQLVRIQKTYIDETEEWRSQCIVQLQNGREPIVPLIPNSETNSI